ncbi:hypothetical protein [Anaeromicropila populeti]|uniref:Uncharacterized protein n=1 Tax=Anaeromicropila populeti TaxID=37658 RepID=A0A1I6L4F2_9FIRM|nr:hypothetical protein [Anaeromicropila populeti]SFR98363.1 hypothetical protein SAMN05661086_03058 [Anaeromicropila populeti]
MQMILNELSSSFPVYTVNEGKIVMKNFLSTYREMKKKIGNEQAVLDKDYNVFELAFGYNIARWREDSTVDMDEKRQFRSLLNKSCVYSKDDFTETQFDITGSEFYYNDKNAIGCLLAYETGDIVISFLTNADWC